MLGGARDRLFTDQERPVCGQERPARNVAFGVPDQSRAIRGLELTIRPFEKRNLASNRSYMNRKSGFLIRNLVFVVMDCPFLITNDCHFGGS